MSSSSASRSPSPLFEDKMDSTTSSCLISCTFNHLPAELRLKVWSCSVEPRIIILEDLMGKDRSYPIPAVTQLNHESRTESRCGYEAVGKGSYVHFARDVIVCDPSITDKTEDPALEAVAERIERVVFWDCFPDDTRIELPFYYSSYLEACYRSGQSTSKSVACDKLWFPNLKELWVIKIGHIDKSWNIEKDEPISLDTRFRQTARKFRYWIEDGAVEMATLSVEEPDTKLVLQQGRCSKVNCRELNHGRPLLVSKVLLMDGQKPPGDSPGWQRILPCPSSTAAPRGEDVEEVAKEVEEICKNSMRWSVVERALTFSLRWDWPGPPWMSWRRRNVVRGIGNGGCNEAW